MRAILPLPNIQKKTAPFVAGLLVAVFGLASLVTFGVAHASASPDCDFNSIIHCGFTSKSDFIAKVRANDSLNANHQHDLIPIYKHYGLAPTEYNRFLDHAVSGTAYRNGDMYANIGGKNVKVGTDGFDMGRLASYQGSGYKSIDINGTTYYGNVNDKVFAPTHDVLPVTIMFDSSGKVEFAVMNNCGNAITVTPIAPTYACNNLVKSAVAGQPNAFNFSTNASAGNGATIDHVVYDFGDGTGAVTRNSPTTVVQHTYSKGGNFTAKVTVYVTLPGDGTKVIAPAGDCLKVVSVPKPSYSCTQLVGAILDKSQNSYTFKVTGAYNAANTTPTSADFNFGDGHTKTVSLTSTNGTTTATATNDYKDATADYTATAVLHFKAYGNAFATAANDCPFVVHVTIPFCQGLTGAFLDNPKTNAQFTATAVLNGTTLSTADFDFGDGTTKAGVAKTTDTTVVIAHKYAKGGTYNASATLHFTANNKGITAVTCRALVSPDTITPECKPGVPVGDARCNPCPTNPSVSADDTVNCVVPQTTLPNTGAGNTIAIFSVVVIGGFLGYRQILFRRHKAAFMAAQYGTSPLPLANPIDDNAPLAGTPLAPKKRGSLRRKRPF